jgi:peroxiredoxin Q/BCP
MALHEGDVAPDFGATLSNGERFVLSEYRGKKIVVLFFYPKDFTPGCTAEVCSFRDNYDELTKYDALLLGVSSDPEESHRAFIQRHHLPFPLISDSDRTIARAYGVSARLGGILPGTQRVTFVIDKQGIIRRILHHEVLITKHLAGVLETLKSLAATQ